MLIFWCPLVQVCATLRAGMAFCSTKADLIALKITPDATPALGAAPVSTLTASATSGAALQQATVPAAGGLRRVLPSLSRGVSQWVESLPLTQAADTGAMLAQYVRDGRIVLGSVPSGFTPYQECPSLEAYPWHT